MKLSMKLAPAVVALLLSAAPAAAVPTFFGVHEGWQVYQMDDASCVMDTSFSGTKVTIFSTPSTPQQATIGIQNPAWKTLEVGQKYPIRIEMAGQTYDVIGLTSKALDGGVWIVTGVSRQTLMPVIGSGKRIDISTSGKPLTSLGGGAIEAAYVFSRCANKLAQGDPFAR